MMRGEGGSRKLVKQEIHLAAWSKTPKLYFQPYIYYISIHWLIKYHSNCGQKEEIRVILVFENVFTVNPFQTNYL